MRKIFIAGSRKFYPQIEQLVQDLKANNVVALTPKKQPGVENFEHEKQALLQAFKMIDDSESVYVVAVDGYIGKTVAIEMSYAYAKGKPIFSSQEISEFSSRALVTQIKNYQEEMI